MKAFAEKFRAARIAARLTQTETAAIMGRSSQTVSNWETGRITPPELVQRGAMDALQTKKPAGTGGFRLRRTDRPGENHTQFSRETQHRTDRRPRTCVVPAVPAPAIQDRKRGSEIYTREIIP